MMVVVGLGNPGKKYKKTRHNAGSMAIDKLVPLNLEGVILAKPDTFMNESGKAIKSILKNHKLKIEDLIVIHDDIDLPLGKIRIVKNRGAGGHKGVGSIIKELGTENFTRIRIGICPPKKPRNPEKFVLKKFKKKEEEVISQAINKISKIIDSYLKEGLEKTMNEFNR